MSTMVCTRCFRDTFCDPPTVDDVTSVDVVIALAQNWLCNDCLDEVEDEPSPSNPQQGEER